MEHTLNYRTGEMLIESTHPSSTEAALSFVSEHSKQESLHDQVPSAICACSTPKLVYKRKKFVYKQMIQQQNPDSLLSAQTTNSTKGSCVSANGCLGGEVKRKDEAQNRSIYSAKDSCSSSKSNIALASVKTDIDDTGECECSSSSTLATGMQGEKPSEKELCISILRNHGLLEKCSPARSYLSIDILHFNGDTNSSQPCKICGHSGNRLSMLICDSCEEAFHVPCCIPRVKKVPIDDWHCRSCSRKKPKLSPETDVKSVVSDFSNRIPQGGEPNVESIVSECRKGTIKGAETNVKAVVSECSKGTPTGGETNVNTVVSACSKGTPTGGETLVKTVVSEWRKGTPKVGETNGKTVVSECRKGTPKGGEPNVKTVVSECKKGTPKGGEPNVKTVVSNSRKKTSKGGSPFTSSMLIDSDPYTTDVRIGKGFQAEVPEWTGPIFEDFDYFGEPAEIDATKCSSSYGRDTKKAPAQNSIGNWLQCKYAQDDNTGDNAEICGKWRRAPLVEVQTDDWSCFDSVRWDPHFADCAVPQELGTDQVLTHLKYVELLKPRITAAANKRKLDASKNDTGNARSVTPKHCDKS